MGRKEGDAEPAREAKPVFVTVGTTSFDALVEALDDESVVQALRQRGFTSLTIQIGRGTYVPKRIGAVEEGSAEAATQPAASATFFPCRYYRFKSTLENDMKSAALIVSHAGAGSIMESLRLKKPLVVVVNEDLMDNHQEELAEAMEAKGVLRKTRPADVVALLGDADLDHFEVYPPRDAGLFPALLDQEMYADV
ncbi:UDP-N-acetylglucosamine transferase subunit ALG13-like [Hondaea fermentalgiana]|uniref:UDP-N-acetylglucosamine transferase subunit ALG13-like n=1 Tax=Hondaea fermentalgiana TaxID=2315210 RepID=A0A2R5GZU5_9STRA|nr:UDP-N-acetylglucosamine transferase subunit ALG13-like [Hondaea fermentalgiana]|eukprot:GBG33574.1 UDP-N-acetylglucosamine transferase subunit ALG13-like [Hondaea fermentalgiana]